MYKKNINKEELSALDKVYFKGKIHIIDTKEKSNLAISVLEKEKIIGFDTESKPSFVKGVPNNQISLLQLSTKKECFLFRLNKIGLPKNLIHLLVNIKIKKIGLSLKDDFLSLK